MKIIAHHHDVGQTSLTVPDGLGLPEIRRIAADRLDIRPSGEPEIAIFAEMTDAAPAPSAAGSVFSHILSEELDRRNEEQRRTDEFVLEHRTQVEMLHAIFREAWPELSKLQLRGDYGRPVSMHAELSRGDRTQEQELEKICHEFGITLSGGCRAALYEFCVSVQRRAIKAPHNFHTKVYIRRHYPYKDQDIYTCHFCLDEAAAQSTMAEFFRTVAKYIYVEDKK